MMNELVRRINRNVKEDEIHHKQFDEDMANSMIERKRMLEDMSNISRIVQEIRDILKDEKARNRARANEVI
jgi:DNA primase large subunit